MSNIQFICVVYSFVEASNFLAVILLSISLGFRGHSSLNCESFLSKMCLHESFYGYLIRNFAL